eukprot:639260-Amorphochlora_amoeboformis.AAC.1
MVDRVAAAVGEVGQSVRGYWKVVERCRIGSWKICSPVGISLSHGSTKLLHVFVSSEERDRNGNGRC